MGGGTKDAEQIHCNRTGVCGGDGRRKAEQRLYWAQGQRCAKMTFELMEREASETVEQKQKERT